MLMWGVITCLCY